MHAILIIHLFVTFGSKEKSENQQHPSPSESKTVCYHMLHCCYYEVQTPKPTTTTTATREKYIFLNNSLLTAHDFVFVAVISESRRISTKVNLFCTGL